MLHWNGRAKMEKLVTLVKKELTEFKDVSETANAEKSRTIEEI